MQATGDADAFQRFLLLEPLTDLAENGHLPFGPLDAVLTVFGQREILDVILHVSSPSIPWLCWSVPTRSRGVRNGRSWPSSGRWVCAVSDNR